MVKTLTMGVENSNILIVDDDKIFIIEIKKMLSNIVFDINFDEAYSEKDFYNLFKPNKYNLIILDLRLRKENEGMDLLKYAIEKEPEVSIIILTGYESVDTARKSFRIGAKDYLVKGEYRKNKDRFIDEFKNRVKKIIIEDKARKESEKQKLISISDFFHLGTDIKMRKVLEFSSLYAIRRISPILLIGEYGTIKDKIARFIYKESKLKGEFIQQDIRTDEKKKDRFFNPENLDKLITKAQNGILYITEVFNLNTETQKKLIDILNNEEAGTNKNDIQFIFSTTLLKDPSTLKNVPEKKLYHMIKTPADIIIPPLRERGEDIVDLAYYYLSLIRNQGKVRVKDFSDEVIEKLKSYPWPANDYELEKTVESSAIKATINNCRKIELEHLSIALYDKLNQGTVNLEKILADTSLNYLKIALEKSNYEKIKAYEYLEYKSSQRNTLKKRIKNYFESYPEFKKKYSDVYKRFK